MEQANADLVIIILAICILVMFIVLIYNHFKTYNAFVANVQQGYRPLTPKETKKAAAEAMAEFASSMGWTPIGNEEEIIIEGSKENGI